MVQCALTTVDNPFDPIEDFDNWWKYDTDKGYNTSGVLMRFAETSDEFTENENMYEIERAIDFIIAHDLLNRFKKVKKIDGKPAYTSTTS